MSEASKELATSVHSLSEPSLSSKSVAENKLVWKLDVVLMPPLMLAYFTHTLDRANLGNAKTGGLEADLGLVGNQYSLLLILFYIPYGIFNIPATMSAKRFNPAVVMPIIMGAWGTLAMALAAATSFGGILTCRVLMGAVKAGFLPCAMFYCSLFYTRKELALRISAFGMMGFIAGAVSGIIAYSVFQWHRELKGWQYLFLIEGALTVGISIFNFFWLPRSVTTSRWFTEEEAKLSQSRLDQDTTHEKGFVWADAVTELKDWKVWSFGFMALMYGIGSNSSSNFLPTMVKRLTVDTAKANLYTVGPNLTAAFIQLSTSWLSDHFQHRATFSAGALLVSLIGFVLLGTLDLVHEVKVGYFITYLITFGTFTPGILVPAWVASNTHTTTGRALTLGLLFMGQNFAGIISSAVFRAQDAPVYKPALVTVAVTQGVFIVICLLQRQYYARINKKLDRGEIGHVAGMELNPSFRYAL
ncbi:MFS general substrate transporter [Mollisia scopiformis]|uniref:MFS general substrate transporter n=1 Tax=Mollisia scopiformis TaxID=149040 RepID=A0A194WTI7_MOLSC|nr:MFS general substrate transporter [Mollisia scopiformis]KUJ11265.1 MFS general substrate transporter [Mollisia scopiformis]